MNEKSDVGETTVSFSKLRYVLEPLMIYPIAVALGALIANGIAAVAGIDGDSTALGFVVFPIVGLGALIAFTILVARRRNVVLRASGAVPGGAGAFLLIAIAFLFLPGLVTGLAILVVAPFLGDSIWDGLQLLPYIATSGLPAVPGLLLWLAPLRSWPSVDRRPEFR